MIVFVISAQDRQKQVDSWGSLANLANLTTGWVLGQLETHQKWKKNNTPEVVWFPHMDTQFRVKSVTNTLIKLQLAIYNLSIKTRKPVDPLIQVQYSLRWASSEHSLEGKRVALPKLFLSARVWVQVEPSLHPTTSYFHILFYDDTKFSTMAVILQLWGHKDKCQQAEHRRVGGCKILMTWLCCWTISGAFESLDLRHYLANLSYWLSSSVTFTQINQN